MHSFSHQEHDYMKQNAEFERQKLLLEKQRKRSDQLQMALEILNRNLTKEKDEKEQLLKQIEGTKSDKQLIQTMALELKKAKLEIDHIRQENNKTEQVQAKKLEQYMLDIAEISENAIAVKGQYEQLQQEFNRLQADYDKGQSDYQKLEGIYTEAKFEISQLQQAQQELETELSEQVSSNEVLKNQYAYILEESTEKQLQLEEQVIHLTSQVQMANDDKEAVEQTLNEQTSIIAQYKETIETLTVQAAFNEEKLELKTAELEELKEQILQMKQALAQQQLVNVQQQEKIQEIELTKTYDQQLSCEGETILKAKDRLVEEGKGKTDFEGIVPKQAEERQGELRVATQNAELKESSEKSLENLNNEMMKETQAVANFDQPISLSGVKLKEMMAELQSPRTELPALMIEKITTEK